MTRQMLSDSREPCVYTGSMTDHSLLNNNGFHGCLFSHILRFVSRSNSWHTLRQWKYRLFTVSVCVAQERWWVQPNLSVKGEKKKTMWLICISLNHWQPSWANPRVKWRWQCTWKSCQGELVLHLRRWALALKWLNQTAAILCTSVSLATRLGLG